MLPYTYIYTQELQHGASNMNEIRRYPKTTVTLQGLYGVVIRSRALIRQTFRTLSLILKYGY